MKHPSSDHDEALAQALASFPSLGGVTPALADLIAQTQAVPANTVVFAEHAPCQGFPLVLAGEVQVFRQSADGRRLELYRVGPGELCLVSAASLFRQQALGASGRCTRDSQLLLVPPGHFQAWLTQPAFRAEVLGLFAQRLADLTQVLDAVAFQKLDQRLAAALLGHGPALTITHQALADQLGTVREIVSRLLNRFEQAGWVQLSRERIDIVDSAALRQTAAGQAGCQAG